MGSHIYTDWGLKNHNAWIHSGFDNLLFTPNGLVHRLLTRLAVENLFHPFQPFILGQYNLSPKIADLYDIPLIFYGECGSEYGNPKDDMTSAKKSWEYFSSSSEEDMFIGGSSLSELRSLGLNKIDWEPYLPIDPSKLEEKKIEVHFLLLGEMAPQGAYYYSIEHGDFQSSPERSSGTYSTYNSIDDKIDDFHYHSTFIKFGIGRATYDAAQEVRSGDLTRKKPLHLSKNMMESFHIVGLTKYLNIFLYRLIDFLTVVDHLNHLSLHRTIIIFLLISIGRLTCGSFLMKMVGL